jgi:ankyrin repeat protein/predicted esterase
MENTATMKRTLDLRWLAMWCLLAFCPPGMIAGEVPLVDAAEQGKFELVRLLLERGSDVNVSQVDGMSALHWAVYHDQIDVVRRIIDAGARVQEKNRYGVSPLSLACQNGNAELVQLLLAKGADANTMLPGGETALMTAARTGRLGPVQSLIAQGADVNARERKGQTALMWAAADGHVDVVDALIAAGADVTTTLDSGFNALFFAAREGRTQVVLRLLAAGGSPNQIMTSRQGVAFGQGPLRITPLLMAIENGHFELAKTLLDQGADPNAAPSGYTALHALTWVRKPILGDGDPPPTGSGKYSSLDMARMLIAAGANIDARFERGKSGLGRFTYTGSTPFLLAAQTSDLPLMKLLAELGANADLANADGTTPLLAASGVGALGDGDEAAGTEQEAIAAIKYLLELGADVNAVDHNGETAMHGAAYQSLAELAKVLVEHDADVQVWNRENRAGWTPFAIALGYRPGNFRPAPATIAAIQDAMLATGTPLPDLSELKSHRRGWSGSSNEDRSWVIKDIEYARVNDAPLLLDLHLPLHVQGSSLVVWVHGGAWRMGSKDDMPLQGLVEAGYTVASVEYRLSPVAPFPAQLHDLKASIRFLRSLSARYGFRADRIAIAGASAGGHLAALVGTTGGHEALEGTVGGHLQHSSHVQAIVSLYAPTNLLTILPQSTPHGLAVRVPALQLLLGGQPEDEPELAKTASPVSHVDATDPPLLLIHGDQDPQVPINQSHELYGKYKQHDLRVRFEVIHGAAHGGPEFYDAARQAMIESFLNEALRAESDCQR